MLKLNTGGLVFYLVRKTCVLLNFIHGPPVFRILAAHRQLPRAAIRPSEVEATVGEGVGSREGGTPAATPDPTGWLVFVEAPVIGVQARAAREARGL